MEEDKDWGIVTSAVAEGCDYLEATEDGRG